MKIQLLLLLLSSVLMGAPNLEYLDIAGAKIFLYETEYKNASISKIQSAVNRELSLNVECYELPWPITQIVVSSVHNLQSLYSDNKHPIVVPPEEVTRIDEYVDATLNQIDQIFKTRILYLTKDLNLIYSQHAHKFHKDVSDIQAEMMYAHPGKYQYVQDLTLIDWEMQPGTVSGTLFYDEVTKDRYLLTLFPGQKKSFFIVDAQDHIRGEALPHHCALTPIDLYGKVSNGSEKGQRLSFAIRGIGATSEVNALLDRSSPIDTNSPVFTSETDRVYPNGIIIKSLDSDGINLESTGFTFKSNRAADDIDILEHGDVDERILSNLCSRFDLQLTSIEGVEIKRIIKRTPGFSSFEALEVEGEYDLLVLNRSSFSELYDCVNLAQGPITEDRLLIQLYHLPNTHCMYIPSSLLPTVCLTPIEEILFRNAPLDHLDQIPPHLRPRIYTVIDLIFIPKLNLYRK